MRQVGYDSEFTILTLFQAQSQFVYPDIALGSDVMKPIMQPHYTSPPGHISVRGTKYQFPPGSIQQGIQRSIPPQIQQASPGQSQQMQRPMVVPQQQYTQRLQSVNQQQRPINAPMQPSYQQSVMPNATTQKHELLQNSPKALLGTLLQQVPSEYQPQFLTLYSKLQVCYFHRYAMLY